MSPVPNTLMKILFITPGPLGDTVLSLGLLSHFVKVYPDAEVTIATGPLGMTLFDGLANVQERISLKKQKRHGHWINLWKKVVKTRWDIVVDMRNSAVSRLVSSRQTFIKRQGGVDPEAHVVVQNAQLAGLGDNPPSPMIWLSEDQKKTAAELLPGDQKYIGVGPTANFIGKMWPPEYFVGLLHHVIAEGSPYEGHSIAVFGAPNEQEQARQVIDHLPKHKVINLVGRTQPGTGAACLGRCDFYIGNDSGLMHCAAALGVKTFGLFGPSRDENYRPWGEHCSYIRTPESRDELIGHEDFKASEVEDSMMRNLTVDMVEKKLLNFLENRNYSFRSE